MEIINKTFLQRKEIVTPAKVVSVQKTSPSGWFPGLNGLRFLAASLVVIMHSHTNQKNSGLLCLPDFPILYKGLYAVSFFFVLSGFLITYLLLTEQKKASKISIKQFYLRRVFRIWPLYFIVILIGTFFYWKLVPALGLHFETDYPHTLAIVLYVLFLSNLMNSLFHVGGILHVTWSIAVEEQFYLFWAPLVKRFKGSIIKIIMTITILSLIVNMINTVNGFHLSVGWQLFISTLQFHYMGIGAGFAWLLFNHKEKLLNNFVFSSKIIQVVLTLSILSFFFLYTKNITGELIAPLPIGLIFGCLIINVAANPARIFTMENNILNYLGKISYGIYMYHVPVLYGVTFLFTKLIFLQHIPILYFSLYYLLIFFVAIAVASISFYLIEKPILKLYKHPTKPIKAFALLAS